MFTTMTEAQFEQLSGDTRLEFVDGQVIELSPETDYNDQLQGQLRAVLSCVVARDGLGEVRGPGYTARLRSGLRRIPDVVFIQRARVHLTHEKYLEGAPDLAIEVVSEDSVERDYNDKRSDYEKTGVLEYWILDKFTRRATQLVLGKDGCFVEKPSRNGWLVSTVVPGFRVRISRLWSLPLATLDQWLADVGLLLHDQAALDHQLADERARTEAERTRAEAERARAEREASRAAALEARLRELEDGSR